MHLPVAWIAEHQHWHGEQTATKRDHQRYLSQLRGNPYTILRISLWLEDRDILMNFYARALVSRLLYSIAVSHLQCGHPFSITMRLETAPLIA